MNILLDEKLLESDVQHFEFNEYIDIDNLPVPVSFAQPLNVSGVCSKADDAYILNGKITAELSVNCSRCLKDMEYPLDISFTETFMRDVEDFDDEVYTFSLEEINIDKMVLDNIAMELPVQFLCKPDCKGLCQICGQDLNVRDCGCKREDFEPDNPFSKLKGLFE